MRLFQRQIDHVFFADFRSTALEFSGQSVSTFIVTHDPMHHGSLENPRYKPGTRIVPQIVQNPIGARYAFLRHGRAAWATFEAPQLPRSHG
jgi:hypothetical protein